MNLVTDLADLAVVFPLAVLIAIACFVAGWRRGAAAWSVVFPALCFCMLLLKVLTFSHAPLLAPLGLRSPSGHTSVAILAYGGLLAVSTGLRPAFILLIGAGVGAVIGATRLALGFHTPADVLVGGVVGLCALAVLLRLAGTCPPRARSLPRLLLLLAGAAGCASFGLHVPAENYIRRFSLP